MRDYLEYNLNDEKSRLLGRVQGYCQLGMYKDAIDECKKLIKIDPNDQNSFIELCLTYRESGEIEKAIGWNKYIIRKFPGDSNAYLNLGFVFEKHKKRNNIAAVCYEKALELDPNNEWAFNNVAVILQKEGKWKEALSYYEKAYELSKKNRGIGIADYKILHNLGWAYYNCKRYLKAWLIYDYLADKDPDNAAAYADFGCVCYKVGSYDRALNLFEKALSLEQDSRYFRRLYKVTSKKINQ